VKGEETISVLQNEIEEYRSKVDSLQNQLDSLRIVNETIENLNQTITSNYEASRREQELTSKELNNYRNLLIQTQNELENLQELYNNLKENSISKDEYNKLFKEYNELLSQNEKLIDENKILKNVYGTYIYGERENKSKVVVSFEIVGINSIVNSSFAKNDIVTLRLKMKDLKSNKYIESLERTGVKSRKHIDKQFSIDILKNKNILSGSIVFINTQDNPFARFDDFSIELYLLGIERPLIVSEQNLRKSPRIPK
jgi:chromosome segregation ATPase